MMAVKSEPIDMDSEPPTLFTKSANGSPGNRSAAHDDVLSQPLNLTSHPVNFLTEQGRPAMVVDPLHNDVMFLPPHLPPRDDGGTGEDECGEGSSGGGRGGQRVAARREVTEYATYTISHHEAELNSKLLPKKYRCRFCVYKTSYKSDLNRHLRKHGIAPQHCPLCNMPFKTTGNLENHMRQTHGDMTAGILPPSPSSSSASLSGLCLDAGGFLGPASALAIGGPASLPPVVGGVVVPCVGIAPSSSSTSDLVQFEPSRGRGSRHPHHLSRRLDSQLQHEFPALSQAVLSPAQLSCHVCSFVCSDSEVLARHLLTHPAEEEVSRALASRNKPDEGSGLSPVPVSEPVVRRYLPTPEHRAPSSVTRLACNYCDAILSSIDELQLHRLSCVDPAEVLHCPDGEDLRRRNRKDSQRQDTNKDDLEDVPIPSKDKYREAQTKNAEGNRGPAERTLQGLPRQETMEKLRRTLTNQTVTSALPSCRSTPSQNQPPYQQQTSMILPHTPATENTDSGNAVVRKTSAPDTSQDSHDSDVMPIVIGSDDSPVSVVICEDDTLQHRDADNQHSDSHVPGRLKSNPETPVIQPTRESVSWSDEDSECERTVGKVTEQTDEHRRTYASAYKDTAASHRPESCAVQPAYADKPPPHKRARKSSLCNTNSFPIDLSSCQRWREASDRVLQLIRPDISMKEEPASPDASTDTEAFRLNGGCTSMSNGCKVPSSQAQCAGDRHACGIDTQRCASCGKMLMGKDQLLRHLQQVHGLKSRFTDSSSLGKIKAASRGDPGNVGKTGSNTCLSSLGHRSCRRTTSGFETTMQKGGSKSSRTRRLTSAVVSPVAQAATNLTTSRNTTESHSFSCFPRSGYAVDTKVTSHPPMSGRYAKLVSDFEEFSRQPYACSLCFFCTARLCELRTHVRNHLTGGNAAPVADTATLQTVDAFSVERGTSPGVRSDSLRVRNMSPDVRSSSPSVKSHSPGASIDCQDVLITTSDFRINSSGIRCSSPCVIRNSPGVRDNSPGVRDNSPGVRDNSPGVRNNSAGPRCNSSFGQCNSPGVEGYSSNVRITSPGTRNTSPGIRNTSLSVRSTSVKVNGDTASSAGSQSPGCVAVPHGNATTAAVLPSVEILVASPHVSPNSASSSSLASQTPECVDVSDAPAPTEAGSSELSAFPFKMNSVSSTSSPISRSLVVSGAPEKADGDVSSVAGNGLECNVQSVSDSDIKAHHPALPPIHADCANELTILAQSSSSGEGGVDPKSKTKNGPASEYATIGMLSHLSTAVVAETAASWNDEPCALDLTSTVSPEKTGTPGNWSTTTDDDVTATLFNNRDDDINNNIRRDGAVQTETTASTGAEDDGHQTSVIHRPSSPSPSDTTKSLLPVTKLTPDQENSSRCDIQDSKNTSLDDFTENKLLPVAEEQNARDPHSHSDDVTGEMRSPSPELTAGSEQLSNTVHTATSSSEMVHSLRIPRAPQKSAGNNCTRKTALSRTVSRERSRCPTHIVNRRKGKRANLHWKQKLFRKTSADLLSSDWSNGLSCTNPKNRCSHCGKSFSLRQLLVRHMRCIH